ncbi:MAG TPA: glycosyltransferase [Ignavibacteria bacterium]|nr:glycosyltransferase [Ignavibacteria bacterium]
MKVSIWMSAYNHEKYISQCLDSVLMQKTNFDFEIIIGEDCSKDKTREIVIGYERKFPGKIKLFLPEKNIGMMQMDVATRDMCNGEYIALLNGDDYWTDENKLQIQSDFLDSNIDTVMCYHKAKVENETNGESFETYYGEKDDTLPVESLLLGYNPVMTPTVMIRNILKIPDYFSELPYGDMPLYLLLAEKGKIKYIDKLMSVYRIHSSGQWQGEKVHNNLLKDINFYTVMNEKLNFKYERAIRKIFAQRYFDLSICKIKQNKFDEARNFYEQLKKNNLSYSQISKDDENELYRILFEGAFTEKSEELLKREVKWKIN